MKLFFRYLSLCFVGLSCSLLYSQSGFFLNTQESKKIKFEFTSNLIILPVEVNGVTLSFVLDSGVSKPILFNLSESDSLNLKDTETFFLHGLGADGKIEALKSKNNIFKIGDAISTNQDLYVLFDNSINFTPRLGVLVHGIIGYDLFKNFVVEINYNSEYIKIYKHETFKLKNSKKWQTIPINLYRRKPYVNANVFFSEQNIKTVKLLIDTGSSDALWLFEDIKNGIIPDTERFFRDYLGKGLSGSVYGKRSKVKKFNLANYNLNDVNVSFPDPSSVDLAKMHKDRKGSLGGDILKRFNIIFDYRNQDIHLKKNSYFKNRFTYNNSGIILEHNGNMFVKERVNISRQNQPSNGYSSVRNNDKSSRAVKIDYSIDYIMRLKPAYKIVEIRETSNAYASGLRVGDIVISINKVLVYNYRLPEINQFFHDKTGTTLTMKVERDGKEKFFKFKLDDAFKINKPSN